MESVQRLELNEDVNVEDRMWAKRFASRHNFGFDDSDDDDDWENPDETYVVCCLILLSLKLWSKCSFACQL